MLAVCNASVPLAEFELESLAWPARRQRYKPLFQVFHLQSVRIR